MGYRIFLVDDDLLFGRMLRRTLSLEGHALEVFSSAADATTELQRGTEFEVALVDYHLGDSTAAQFRDATRSCARVDRWFALSGVAHPSEVFQLASTGYHDYFEKSGADLARLKETLARPSLAAAPEQLSKLITAWLGTHTVAEAQRLLRDAMVRGALHDSGGNITKAAAAMGVTRQAMQWFKRQLAEEANRETAALKEKKLI